jgi:hypothetical protein
MVITTSLLVAGVLCCVLACCHNAIRSGKCSVELLPFYRAGFGVEPINLVADEIGGRCRVKKVGMSYKIGVIEIDVMD